MPKIKDAHTRDAVQTEYPHIARQVTLFKDIDPDDGQINEWAWFDDTNITLFGSLSKLKELGIDTKGWKYSDDGNTYNLPQPLAIAWKQREGKKTGRPYKQVLGLSADVPNNPERAAELLETLREGVVEAQAEPERIDVKGERKYFEQEGFVYLDAEKFKDELFRIAPDLASAHAEHEAASEERKRLERAALEQFRADNHDLYERENQAEDAHDDLKGYAQQLVTLYGQASGNTGRILGGQYQINAPEKLQMVEDELEDFIRYLVVWMPHLLVDIPGMVTINLDALHKKLKGSIPDAMAGLKAWVKYAPVLKPQINWSKLPEPATNGKDADASAGFRDDHKPTASSAPAGTGTSPTGGVEKADDPRATGAPDPVV